MKKQCHKTPNITIDDLFKESEISGLQDSEQLNDKR